MKYSNSLQQEIIEHLLSDGRFHCGGYTGTHFINSWSKEEKETKGDFIDLKNNRSYSGKDSAKVRFYIFSNDDTEMCELKIEMYLPSYFEWETFFQGWVDNLNDFHNVLKYIGL